MKGEIQSFVPIYMSRIAQLTNKSDQFNLTTKRYSQTDIAKISKDPGHITLYGKLVDKFGDNGVVSVVIGRIAGVDMDELIKKDKAGGIRKLVGYYYPTAKNAMVKEFYELQGFTKINEDEEGNTTWEFIIGNDHKRKQHVIMVNEWV